jgi:hypothetical protein
MSSPSNHIAHPNGRICYNSYMSLFDYYMLTLRQPAHLVKVDGLFVILNAKYFTITLTAYCQQISSIKM